MEEASDIIVITTIKFVRKDTTHSSIRPHLYPFIISFHMDGFYFLYSCYISVRKKIIRETGSSENAVFNMFHYFYHLDNTLAD